MNIYQKKTFFQRIFYIFLLSILFICSKNTLQASMEEWDGITIEESWYNALRTTFELDSASQLAGLAAIVNRGDDNFTDKTIILRFKMNLGRQKWTPIGNETNRFNGTFDGSGYIIEGLNVDTTGNVGLFGYTDSNSTILNLGITCNCTITGVGNVGSISGYNKGYITLCFNKGVILSGTNCGGISGINTGTIECCYNIGSIENATICAGGIVGSSFGIVRDCYNVGSITSNIAGGIVGIRDNISDIENCYYTSSNSSLLGVGSGSTTGTELKSRSDLQNPNFINILKGNSWTTDSYSKNNEFPIFMWQASPLYIGEETYTINAINKGGGGVIIPSGIVTVCLEQTFTIIPDECYNIKNIIVDGVSVGNKLTSYTFSDIDSNHTIEVIFESFSSDTIIASYAKGGKILVDDNIITNLDTILICTDKIFKIVPDECHKIKEVLIDGTPNNNAKINGEHKFTTGQGNHKIHVEFSNNTLAYVSTSAVGGGRIKPTGDSIPLCGNKTFSIIPDECYKIKEVWIDGVLNDDAKINGEYEFTDQFSDHTISAIFEPTYTLTVIADSGGTTSHQNITTACDGEKIVFYPDPCYVVKEVIVNNKKLGNPKFYILENVNEDITISVSFEKAPNKTHTIFCSTVGSGTITPGGKIYIETCKDTTIKFTPNKCYILVDVEIDSVSIGPVSSYTFVGIAENHSVRATFEESGYSLIHAIADYGGKIYPYGENNDGIISGKICSDTTFYIIPDNCYAIKDVVVDGKSMGPIKSYTFKNVTGDHFINAAFTRVFRIQTSCDENATIEPSGLVLGRLCSDTTFIIKVDTCYEVADVIVNGQSMGPITSYTFNDIKTIHHTIDVKTKPISHLIKATCSDGGIIDPQGDIYIDKCSDTTFTFYPTEENIVAYVIVDGDTIDIDSTTTSYTFKNIYKDHTIYIEFKPNWYIDATAGHGGKIEPSGRKYFDDITTEQTYIITPSNKYAVKDVIINNHLSVGKVNTYTFDNVKGKQSIHAEFIRTFVLNSSCTENGTITPLGSITVEQGDTVTYTIVPDQGYYAKIYINGFEIKGNLAEYKFENIKKDNDIHVVFLEGSSISQIVISDLALYPNPTNNSCTISGNLLLPAKDINITINDLSGRYIKQIYKGNIVAGQFSYKFDTSELFTGIYNIVIKVDDKTLIKKLIIER